MVVDLQDSRTLVIQYETQSNSQPDLTLSDLLIKEHAYNFPASSSRS